MIEFLELTSNSNDATTFSRMALSIKALTIKTLTIKTLTIKTLTIKSLTIKALTIKTLTIKTLTIKTLTIKTLTITTFTIMDLIVTLIISIECSYAKCPTFVLLLSSRIFAHLATLQLEGALEQSQAAISPLSL